MPPLPEDLQALADEIEAITRQTDTLLDPLDDEQFNWSPRPGAWSIGQCFDHLNAVNAVYFEGIHDAVDAARQAGLKRRGPIRSSLSGRLFIWSRRAPVAHEGARACHREARRPAPQGGGVARVRALPRAPADLPAGLRRRRSQSRQVPEPVHPKGVLGARGYRAAEALTAHDRRHVWQATRVREAEGFPRS
jgi:hypothetical protein